MVRVWGEAPMWSRGVVWLESLSHGLGLSTNEKRVAGSREK